MRIWLAASVLLASAAIGLQGQSTDFEILREEVVLETEDGLKLAGTYSYPDHGFAPAPAVLLIHQFGHSREEWGDIGAELARRGYHVLAIDLRGHGDSQNPPLHEKRAILWEPAQADLDVKAGLDWLKGNRAVDPERIAAVGGSIGGNLVCVASARGWIKTGVAISARTKRVKQVLDDGDFRLQSVYFIASTWDRDRDKYARELYERTQEPRKIDIVNSGEHAVGILRVYPHLQRRIHAWLEETLGRASAASRAASASPARPADASGDEKPTGRPPAPY